MTTLIESVRTSLSQHQEIDLRKVQLALDHGALIIEGELDDVAAKRHCLEAAAAVSGVEGIVDRLHVAPAAHMSDADIRDHVANAILGEPAFAGCALRVLHGGDFVQVQSDGSTGSIDVRVQDGVVTLDGEVPNLCLKRLAGVLAWWVPGTRDVVDGLGVEPPQEDSDDEIADAVSVALEKDPFVGAGRISVSVRRGVVVLDGAVRSADEKRVAEHDTWFVFGVNDVANRLSISP